MSDHSFSLKGLLVSLALIFSSISSYSLPNITWDIKSVKIGNFNYDLDTFDNFARVASAAPSLGSPTPKDITIPDYVSWGGAQYVVCGIGDKAFKGSSITSVKGPSKLTFIYDDAFANCVDLKKIELGNVVQYIEAGAFAECSQLSNIDLPSTVKSIGSKAFYNCESLTSITIPKETTTLASDIFIGCTQLSDLQLSEENSTFTLENGILYNKAKSKTILINPRMAVIMGNWRDFSFPTSLNEIGPYSLYGLRMEFLKIPGTVRSIGNYAFGNGEFVSVEIEAGKSEIDISINSFDKAQFTELVLDRNIVETTNVNGGPFTRSPKLKKVILGSNIKKINYRSFWGCPFLTDLYLGNSVTQIGESAFGQCPMLRNVDFGMSVENIGDYAFEGCMLRDITLPASLKNIGKDILQCDMSGWGSITCFAPKAPSALDSFKSLDKQTWDIKVPIGSSDSYRATSDWKYFKNIYEVREDGSFPVAESIHINEPASRIIKIGEKVQLSVTILPDNAHDKSVKWKSSDRSIIEVVDGKIVGLKEGVSVITATDAEGHFDSIEFTVQLIPITRIELTPTSLTIEEGQEQTIIATVHPATASYKKLKWSCHNPEIAEVDESGTVKAIATGKTKVQALATDGSGIMEYCYLWVLPKKEVESIKIVYEGETDIFIGDRIILKTSITPTDASDKSITWTSSKPDILSIDQEGCATAIAEGTAIITATSSNNLTDSLEIKVNPILVTDVRFSFEKSTLLVGDSLQLIAQILPENATDKTVIWESDAPEVLSVSENGMLHALKEGEANITLRALHGHHVEYSSRFRVEMIPVARIDINFDGSSTLGLGEIKQLTTSIFPTNASYKDIKWEVDHPNIIKVSATGTITAVAPGVALIKAVSRNGVMGTQSFYVESTPAKVEKVEISAPSSMVYVLDTLSFKVKTSPMAVDPSTLSWTSSKQDIASFTDGVLTAHKAGSTTISVKSSNGIRSNLINIKVSDIPVEEITLVAPQDRLPIGEYMNIEAIIKPLEAAYQSLTWASSNPQIVEVDQNGRICAKNEGTIIITATASNQVKGSIQISAYRILAQSLELDKHELTLQYREKYSMRAIIHPTNVSCTELKWTSSNPAIVAVDKNGRLDAKSAGSCTITSSTTDGTNLSDKCEVRVPQYVEDITLNELNLFLSEGEEFNLIAIIHPDDAEDTSVEWSSSNPEYVFVDQNGLVRAVKKGYATIRAASCLWPNVYGECSVNVSSVEPPQEQDIYYEWLSENESSLSKGWSVENINLPSQTSYIWKWKATSGKHYLAGSSYINGVSYASTAIVYSPIIDLRDCNSAYFTFEHAAKFQTTLKTCCRIIIRKVNGQWEERIPEHWPSSGTWNFSPSGRVDLSKYLGEQIQIGFKYGATVTGADTWEIKNVYLQAKKADASINNLKIDGEPTIQVIGNNIYAPDGSRIFNINGAEVQGVRLVKGIYFIQNPCFKKVRKVYIK